MNRSLAARMCGGIVMGLLLGGYIHSDYVRWGSRGRDEFMAHQMRRFDHYMLIPQPTIITVISSVIVMIGALALYETLVFAFSALLKGWFNEQTSN